MYTSVIAISILVAGAVASPSPFTGERIVGGEETTIDKYPYQAVVLQPSFWDLHYFVLNCGATILNNRSFLTAANCFTHYPETHQTRMRVGSTYATNGGIVYEVAQILIHPNYNEFTTHDCDIAIVHSSTVIAHNELVRPAMIAGSNYIPADNALVWAVGWGRKENFAVSEQLRHVQASILNQEKCREYYLTNNHMNVSDNMLCTDALNEEWEGVCFGDSGGALTHNGVVVGVISWGGQCVFSYTRVSVYTRVSRFTAWIQSNA